jgi:hypothetical protein
MKRPTRQAQETAGKRLHGNVLATRRPVANRGQGETERRTIHDRTAAMSRLRCLSRRLLKYQRGFRDAYPEQMDRTCPARGADLLVKHLTKEHAVRGLVIAGVVMILVGVGGLVFNIAPIHHTEQVAKLTTTGGAILNTWSDLTL